MINLWYYHAAGFSGAACERSIPAVSIVTKGDSSTGWLNWRS